MGFYSGFKGLIIVISFLLFDSGEGDIKLLWNFGNYRQSALRNN